MSFLRSFTKQNTVFIFPALLLLIFTLSCCKEDPPKPSEEVLPPLTHEGKNTFGCKINGVNWVAKTPPSIGGPTPLYGTYKDPSGAVYLNAVRKDNDNNIYEIIKIFIVESIYI